MRVPAIRTTNAEGEERIVEDNTEKEQIFRSAFFPPPPDTPNVPTDPRYPQSKWVFATPTDRQILQAIRHLKNGKVTRTGTIPNDAFKAVSNLVVPYLGPIYRATFTLAVYPEDWSKTETIILKKPSKPDYRDANAWRPITLSNGHGRLLNSVVADEITKRAELLGLLPAMQFG
ncbi:hypothetical protein GGU11DRAFT_692793, partial [Lentinula aff. detonsa]